jgi:hypothetical protein
MSNIVTPKMQPRIVSLADLKAKLIPLCLGYVWAEAAIVDLWMKGAPVPQPAHEPERRILIPTHFATWWGEIQQRMGIDVSAQQIYKLASRNMSTHAGHRRFR